MKNSIYNLTFLRSFFFKMFFPPWKSVEVDLSYKNNHFSFERNV